MRRTIIIPLRDSREEPDRLKAANRLCTEVWNLTEQWNILSSKAESIMIRLTNNKLRALLVVNNPENQHILSSGQPNNSQEFLPSTSKKAMIQREIVNDVYQIDEVLAELDRLTRKFSQVEARLPSMRQLNKDAKQSLHLILELSDIIPRLRTMFEAELRSKRAGFADVGMFANREVYAAVLVSYKHEAFIDRGIFDRLYSLEVIEFAVDELPPLDEMLDILRQERAPLHCWVDAAVGYHIRGNNEEFIKLLETAGGDAFLEYTGIEKDQMRALDTLAAYYVQEGHRERANKDRRKECFQKATLLYTTADKIQMYDQDHLLGRAYFCLLEGNKMEQADQQFNFVVNTAPDNIPATLGRACIFFQKRDYKAALAHYKKALKLKPDCPPDVRLGIGHCLVKLGKLDKARIAFERCLELDEHNISAMAALSIMDANLNTKEGIKQAVTRLIYAYKLENNHPIILNHLANHFFFRLEFERVEQLAFHAFQMADTDAIRAESAFQLGRCYHYQRNFEKAFRHYYQSAQYASPSFVLPQFGLGQMYIQRQEFENAINCFEKILKVQPNSAEVLKILGSLYAHTEASAKERDNRTQKARDLLTKLLSLWPDDVEALIDLAQLTEHIDPQKSLASYQQAAKILTEREGVEVPSEMKNNMGSLHLYLGNYEEARRLFEEALEQIEIDVAQGEVDLGTMITMRYNVARSLEHLCIFDEAERIYKEIIRSHPNYVDCYMRLGCLMRDRGQIYESSVWFKEGCSVDQQNVDAWTLIGNLHMTKQEWQPAQKKFEQILKMTRDDAYSNIALGNIWLETLFMPNRNKEKDKSHADRAIYHYTKSLKVQPKNMWAANGIACVLAARGYTNEARDVFSQVREATADFMDVWINIAHVYTEHKQYVAAVQMYSSAIKRFGCETNTMLLLYLARAYYLSGMHTDCRDVLEKILIEQPENLIAKFNYAFVIRKLASSLIRDDKSTLEQVNGAVSDLKTAERIFSWLSQNRDETYLFTRMISKTQCAEQARGCNDVIKQSSQYIVRAQKKDESERHLRLKQEEEREALRQRILSERRAREEEEAMKREELATQRKIYMQMTKDLLKMPEVAAEEKRSRTGGGGGGGKGRRRKGEDGEEFVNDSSDMGDWEMGGESSQQGEKRKKKSTGRKKRERQESGESGGDSDDREERRRRKKERAAEKAEARLSAKQQAKIKSRAFLSSESESSDDGTKKKKAVNSASDESPPPPAFDDSDSAESQKSDNETTVRPKKKRAVMSEESDSNASSKSDHKAVKSEESDVEESTPIKRKVQSDSDADSPSAAQHNSSNNSYSD